MQTTDCKHCGECSDFLHEDIDGYGICKDGNERRCSDMCNLKEMKMKPEDLIKKELEFCESVDMEKNEHGQYICESSNKNSVFNLPYLLFEYKQWLIENKIVKSL